MKGVTTLLVLAALVVFGIYFFNFDVRKPGELPDIQVEGGELPKGKVEVGDVDFGTTTVTVPTIDFDTPEEEARERATGRDEG